MQIQKKELDAKPLTLIMTLSGDRISSMIPWNGSSMMRRSLLPCSPEMIFRASINDPKHSSASKKASLEPDSSGISIWLTVRVMCVAFTTTSSCVTTILSAYLYTKNQIVENVSTLFTEESKHTSIWSRLSSKMANLSSLPVAAAATYWQPSRILGS